MRDVSLIQLDPEIAALIPLAQSGKDIQERYQEIGSILGKKKQDAIMEREASGIEDTWVLAEEAYNGIDDLNRHEYNATRWVKPTTLNAPITTSDGKKTQSKRSTAFVRLTSRYVDAGTAKVCEILLPPNDKAFSFEPTPVPDLIKLQNDNSQMNDPASGLPLWRDPFPDEPGATLAVAYGSANIMTPKPAQPVTGQQPAMQAPTNAQGQQKVPMTNRDAAIQQLEVAKEKAKRAETRIWDWMVECQHTREMRKVIFDSARLGTGVLKGPIPDRRRSMVSSKDPKTGKSTVTMREEIVPIDKWVDVWNIYPAPGCGENIRNGDYIFEREFVSEKQLEDLKGLPGYLDDQIELALTIGPTQGKTYTRNPNVNEQDTKQQYELWYYHGVLRRKDFDLLNPRAGSTLEKNQDRVFAIVTMVNDLPIRAALNPLNFSGNLPYLSVAWQRRPGHWGGVGVGEQIMVPQRIVNAATRALLNNAGISAGPQIIINKEGVTPAAQGEWELTPNKIWYASSDGVIDDVRKAFFCFDVTNVTRPLTEIIQYGMRLAEESTSIPLITQGQSGETTPETLGATQIQNNNANQLLRSIGYRFDDDITEPLVKMYYEFLLLDPQAPEEEKGDWKINAHGSVSLVERAIQDQFILQMGPFTQNPVYGANPKKWFALALRSKHMDPNDVMYSPEEQAMIDSKPVPPPPQVMVAQINAQVAQMKLQQEAKDAEAERQLELQVAQIDAQSEQQIAQMLQQTNQLKVKLDTDRDSVYVRAEMERTQSEHQGRMEELRLKKELAILEHSLKTQINTDQIKQKLADTAMKTKAQKELAAQQLAADLHMHNSPSAADLMKPPAQAPGKAGNGKAFSQV